MQQWQYCTIRINDLPRRTEEIDLLNDAGDEGWELVSITTNGVAYLKRQINGEVATATKTRSTSWKTLANGKE